MLTNELPIQPRRTTSAPNAALALYDGVSFETEDGVVALADVADDGLLDASENLPDLGGGSWCGGGAACCAIAIGVGN